MDGAERGSGGRPITQEAQRSLKLQHTMDPNISTVEELMMEIQTLASTRGRRGREDRE